MQYSNTRMYTNGEYLEKNPDWHEKDSTWKAEIIHRLLLNNKVPIHKLIDIGCGSGGILEQISLKDNNILSLKGYDISPQAISLAKIKENGRIHFENKDFFLTEENGGTIMVIDVLEHVDDYYGFLRQLKARGEFFIFHIPLDLCCRTLIKSHVLLQQRISVGHIHYFSQEMVQWFLNDTGYYIIDWEYTKPIIDTNPAGSIKGGVKKILRNLSFALNKKMSATIWGGYSMMILAK